MATYSEDDYIDSEEEIGVCERLKSLSPKSVKPDNRKLLNKTPCTKTDIFDFQAEVVQEEKIPEKKQSRNP